MDGLKIEIGANIQGAVQQVVKLSTAVTNLGNASAAAGKGLAAIPAALKPINTNSLKQLGEAVNKLKTDIASQGGIKSLPAAFNAISPRSSECSGRHHKDKTRFRSGSQCLTKLRPYRSGRAVWLYWYLK